MSKKIILGILSLLSVVTLVACGSSDKQLQDKVEKKGKLVLAVSPDYAPFEFKALVNGKDKVVGADIELAQAIADELHVKLEVSPMSFDNVLSSLQTGKADMLFLDYHILKSVLKSMIFQNLITLQKMRFLLGSLI